MKLIFCLFLLLSLSLLNLAQTNANKAGMTTSATNLQTPEEEEISRINAQISALYQMNKFDEAIALSKKALEESRKKLGKEHKQTITILSNLAAIYFINGDNEEAASRWRDLLKIYEKLNGQDSKEVAHVVSQLGTVSTKLRDYDSIQIYFKRALEIREKIYGAEHDLVAQSLLNLGQAYLTEREYKKAEPLLQRALEISEKASWKNDDRAIQCLDRLAMLFVMTDRGEDAVTALLKAYKIKNPNVATSDNSAMPKVITEGVLNGRAISLPKPPYPPEARNSGTSGTVVVEVTISETGKVIEAKALSGAFVLYNAALLAARQARFLPTIFEGRAVKITGTINYNFLR